VTAAWFEVGVTEPAAMEEEDEEAGGVVEEEDWEGVAVFETVGTGRQTGEEEEEEDLD